MCVFYVGFIHTQTLMMCSYQGQWWSMRRTQWPQRLQWCDLFGLMRLHLLHNSHCSRSTTNHKVTIQDIYINKDNNTLFDSGYLNFKNYGIFTIAKLHTQPQSAWDFSQTCVQKNLSAVFMCLISNSVENLISTIHNARISYTVHQTAFI